MDDNEKQINCGAAFSSEPTNDHCKKAFLETQEDVGQNISDALALDVAAQTALEKLIHQGYTSVAALDNAFQKLSGVDVMIAQEEKKRLKNYLPNSFSKEFLENLALENQASKQGLLALQIPQTLVVNGQETTCNIATLATILNKEQQYDTSQRKILISKEIPTDILHKAWGDSLKIWSLDASKNAHHTCLKSNSLQADFFLALLLCQLLGKSLPSYNWELDATTRQGHSLWAHSTAKELLLWHNLEDYAYPNPAKAKRIVTF